MQHGPFYAQHSADLDGAQEHAPEILPILFRIQLVQPAAIRRMGLGKDHPQLFRFVPYLIHLLLPVIQMQGGLPSGQGA